MPTAEDYISAWFGGGQQPEEKGVTGHVMDFLSALNAPNRALYGGILGGLSDKPDDSFLEGLKKGWSGETDLGLADLIGLPRPQSEDEWAGYIAKGIPYLIANAVGDPLNLLFAPAKGAGLVGRGVKALGVPEGRSIAGLAASPLTDPMMEKLAGTGLWKALSTSLPDTGGKYGTANQFIMENFRAAKRTAGEGKFKAGELADATRQALEKTGFDPALAEEMFQRNPAALAEQAPEVFAAMTGQLGLKGETFAGKQAARELVGLEPRKVITPDEVYQNYWPRILSEEGARAARQGKGSGGVRFNTDPGASRELLRVVDPEALAAGELRNPLGIEAPVVTKKEFLKETPGGGFRWKNPTTGEEIPVSLTQATQKDITGAGILKEGHFLNDPAEAMRIATEKDLTHKFFLDSIGKAIDAGDVVKLEDMTPAMRQLQVPGLEGYAARKSVANFFENLSSAAFDSATPLGAVGDVLKKFNQSYLGEKLGQFTDLFKSTTLPLHPGFHAGNAISNEFLMYANGGVSPLKIPLRNAQAIAVATGRGADIIPQLKEAGFDILHEAKIRDIAPEASWYGSEAKELAGKPGLFGKVGEMPPFKQIGKAQDFGFKVGGKIEANAKLGVFIDDLIKRIPEDFATMPREAQARILDAAAAKAHGALIDYSPQTFSGLMNQASSIIPFIKWQRGIAGNTLESLTQSPQKLASVGRALDLALQPMDPQDKAIMDPWAKEQSPVQGIGPWKFGSDERGMPQMALAGRYLPWGNIEQFIKRPVDFAESIVNPGIKTPGELMTNYSSFKNRNIDELSGGFPGSILNPITGGPYQGASEQLFGFTLPAAYQYILSQMPGGRYLREANEAGRAGGLWEDKYKDASPDLGTFASWYATGGKQYPFDRMKAMLNRQKEQDKQKAAIKHDINFAGMKGDMRRVMRDMEYLQNQEVGQMWGVAQ
jgi:hypothetical protein